MCNFLERLIFRRAPRIACCCALAFIIGGALAPSAFAQQSSNQIMVTVTSGDGADPFSAPQYVALDSQGNLFVSDSAKSRVQRVDLHDGSVTTVVGTGTSGFSGSGGAATQANIGCPAQLAFDAAGDLFISDACDHVVWKISPGTDHLITASADANNEIITNYVGNGATAGCNLVNGVVAANQHAIDGPAALAIDAGGNLFVSSQGGCENLILRVDAAAGTMAVTNFNQDSRTSVMSFDGGGNLIYAQLASFQGFNVASPAAGQTLLTGNEAPLFVNFSLGLGTDLQIDGAGNLYVGGPLANGTVPFAGQYSKVVPGAGGYGGTTIKSTLIAGTTTAGYSGDGGDPLAAQFNDPNGIAVSGDGNFFIADTGNGVVRGVISGAATAVSAPVAVTPIDQAGSSRSDVSVTFDNVAGAGTTAVVTRQNAPALPPNFELAGTGKIPIPVYYDIVTSAQFSGNITVCITPSSAQPGLSLWHFNKTTAQWDNVTVSGLGAPGSPICGVVTSLSPFALLAPVTQNQPPAITSASAATLQTGVAGSFTVAASGTPAPSIAATGALPPGIGYVDNGDGTGTLRGIATASGVYAVAFTATNSSGSATQGFTLTVNQVPAITSASAATFTQDAASSLTVTATGFPTPALAESGTLPAGVSFVDNHNGTGTLSGKPTAAGTFNVSFTANNGVGNAAVQPFTLTVPSSSGGPIATVTPAGIDFGTVRRYALEIRAVTLKNTGTANLVIGGVSLTPGANTNRAEFLFLNLCRPTLAPGSSCPILVSFFANQLGSGSATLTITDNAAGGVQSVSLKGNVIPWGH